MKNTYEFKPLISKEPFNADFRTILQQLDHPVFTQKDTHFSPRMLTYYDSKELLLYGSDKGKKRLFTAEQFFWIAILSETAKLGYSLLENLQAIKYKFEHTEVLDGNLDKFHFLQYTLAYIIYNRQEHHLKIAEDGSYSFFTYHNLSRIVQRDFIIDASHIDIALGPIAKTIWKKLTGEDLKFKKPTLPKTNYSNKELFRLIESGNYKTIEIVKKKDGSNLVNVIERQDVKDRQDLARMLNLMSHGEVKIHYHEKVGEPVAITRKRRLKA